MQSAIWLALNNDFEKNWVATFLVVYMYKYIIINLKHLGKSDTSFWVQILFRAKTVYVHVSMYACMCAYVHLYTVNTYYTYVSLHSWAAPCGLGHFFLLFFVFGVFFLFFGLIDEFVSICCLFCSLLLVFWGGDLCVCVCVC